jgi:cation transport regulator ChaB
MSQADKEAPALRESNKELQDALRAILTDYKDARDEWDEDTKEDTAHLVRDAEYALARSQLL